MQTAVQPHPAPSSSHLEEVLDWHGFHQIVYEKSVDATRYALVRVLLFREAFSLSGMPLLIDRSGMVIHYPECQESKELYGKRESSLCILFARGLQRVLFSSVIAGASKTIGNTHEGK